MSTGLFLTNGQWRPYPQGYSFGDHTYCPDHILGQLQADDVDRSEVDDALSSLALLRGIDYSDEYSYDDDDFPKIIPDTDEENHCATCGVDLREV